MMRARVVFNFVLNELKPRQANAIKGKMIGAAGVCYRQRRGALIAERHQPLAKERADIFITLQINAANLTCAIVQIEVDVKLIVLSFSYKFGGSGGLAVGSSRRNNTRIARFHFSKMFGNVSSRAQQPLLFAGPQTDAN